MDIRYTDYLPEATKRRIEDILGNNCMSEDGEYCDIMKPSLKYRLQSSNPANRIIRKDRNEFAVFFLYFLKANNENIIKEKGDE